MSARRVLLLVVFIGCLTPAVAFGQVDVSPGEIYPLPGDPNCAVIAVDQAEWS